MNVPNRLTLMRIVLSLIIIFLMLFPFDSININFGSFYISNVLISVKYMIAGILFIIASLTDFLDGYIARKYGLITNTGKMLDAIADKVLVNSVLIILASLRMISPIIPVVIVLRDIVVNAIKMEASSRGRVVAAISSGKIKTAALMIGTTLIFFNNFPFELFNLRVAEFLLYFATIMSIVSMIQYYNLNKGLIFNSENKKM
ncbi:MAG: CDP-diacylglycerol--glycerol-3-phosphate 3-phosphatidyltransferase [bacterium]|nr:CDP-diacylglycerol--glycerol-3-phosphate 3-phosphatidyltransferase [bacterium]